MTTPPQKKEILILKYWTQAIDLIASKPVVLLPFLFLMSVEFLTLFFLYNSPHMPVRLVMASPVSRIYGQAYLHYPLFYQILPGMFYGAKIMVGIVVGALTSGMAVAVVASVLDKKPLVWKKTLKLVFSRYLSLILLAGLLFATVHVLMQQPMSLLLKYFRSGHAELLTVGPKRWFTMGLPVISFSLALILQCLFVYAIPFIVLKKRKFLSALGGGIKLFFRRFWMTLITVFLPMILYIPVSMVRSKAPYLMDRFSPEFIFVILSFSIVVGTFIVDAVTTIATTVIFIRSTDEN